MAPLTSAPISPPTWRTAWCTSSTATSRCLPVRSISPASTPSPAAIPHTPLPGALRTGLTTDEAYAAAIHDVRLFLEGRHTVLARDMRVRMETASQEMRFEEAAGLRDLISTVEEIEERQKMAAAQGDDVDIFAIYAEPRWWRSISSTCATGRSSIAASSSGRPARLRRGHVLQLPAQTDLPRPAVYSGGNPRPRGVRGPRGAGGTAQRNAPS